MQIHAAEQAQIVNAFNAKPFSIQVDVFFPENNNIYSQVMDKQGKFQFQSGDGGEYKVRPRSALPLNGAH